MWNSYVGGRIMVFLEMYINKKAVKSSTVKNNQKYHICRPSKTHSVLTKKTVSDNFLT